MTRSETDRAIEVLAVENPSYRELVDLYTDLRDASGEQDVELVSRRAIIQVLGECLTYLDYVEAELEKSVGISRAAERERILDAFEEPSGQDEIGRAASIVRQWEDFEQYTQEAVEATIER